MPVKTPVYRQYDIRFSGQIKLIPDNGLLTRRRFKISNWKMVEISVAYCKVFCVLHIAWPIIHALKRGNTQGYQARKYYSGPERVSEIDGFRNSENCIKIKL